MHGEPNWLGVDLAADRNTCLQATGVDLLAVVFGEATPYAIRLTDSECVLGALNLDRTCPTDGLRGFITVDPGWSAFPFGVEEHIGVFATAQTKKLPVPSVRIGAGETGYISHDYSLHRLFVTSIIQNVS
jgi:hypothetical protein